MQNCQLVNARLIATIIMLCALPHGAFAQSELPSVKVENIRRVFHDGQHNAFTDLVRYQGKLYLAFRSCPDGHMVHPTSSIIILTSEDDGLHWEKVHQFRVKLRDTRDPHFLVFQDKLLVYTGTWYSGETTLPTSQYDLNQHLGYAAWTRDGKNWQSPVMLEGTFGHYVWRAAASDGKAYLCGRRKIDFDVRPRGEGPEVESLMLESDDGLIWRKRAVFQEREGDETAFLFLADKSILGVGRRGRHHAQILRSNPPYANWTRTDLDRYIGGPLLVTWGDRIVVGGRKTIGDAGPKTALYWLQGDSLVEFAELPSGGDNSYPGFVSFGPNKALVSWYSSHEVDDQGNSITAIYLADLTVVP